MKLRRWFVAWVMGGMCAFAAAEARAEEAEEVDVEEESAALEEETSEAELAQRIGICEICRRTCARGRCLPICMRIRCAAPDLRRDLIDPPPWRERNPRPFGR